MTTDVPPETARVSVIVVAADSGPLLRECVRRALASRDAVEVLVVDNASRDGIPEDIARTYADDDRLRLVRSGVNLGFGPAVNVGARAARGDPLLVLNPDCLLEPDTIGRLLEILRRHPDTGVLGAVACGSDGEPDPASRRRDPLLRRSLNELTGRARSASDDTRHEGVDVPGPIPRGVIEVENISGALMLVPRRVFTRLEGFDEGYFLHFEDLDFCRRARDAGYRVRLAGDVRVAHAKGGSSGHRPVFVSWHKHRGMWRWFTKFDPVARRPLVRTLVRCGIWLHFAVLLPGLWRRRRPSR